MTTETADLRSDLDALSAPRTRLGAIACPTHNQQQQGGQQGSDDQGQQKPDQRIAPPCRSRDSDDHRAPEPEEYKEQEAHILRHLNRLRMIRLS